VQGYAIKEGKTSPPKRYTSGSMVLAMENAGQLIEDEELREQIKGSGIGTSATRAEIIKKLVRIHYLNLNKKTQVLTPENLGEMVYEVVSMTVPALLNPKMTASWEKGLDGITRGTVDFKEYRGKLESFIRTETKNMIGQDIKVPLADRISNFAGENARGLGARKKIGAACPVCGGEMVTTPFGFGCANYKNDKTGCNFTIGEIAGVGLTEEQAKMLLVDGHTDTIKGFKSKAGKKFNACLKLTEDEEGAKRIVFDFDEVEPELIPDVKCPVCGGQIKKTSFGYGCTNFSAEDENSCRFSIGTIAGKTIPVTAVKKLLAEGRTDTVRGFKSKAGKRFDACLKLTKDENGKTGIQFDFDNVEPKKVKDVRCPKCGGEIIVAPFGFVCENNKRDDPDSCRFMVGKVAGLKIKESQLKELLIRKKTDVISGFVAKTGMKFDAPLKLTEEGDIAFDFPEKPKPVETKLPCPRCTKPLMKSQWRYECECGFKIWHTVAKVELPEEIMTELFTTGKTKNKVTGFTSKAGNVFDACLKYENEQITFDFE
jgi:DNA topoisomerase-3